MKSLLIKVALLIVSMSLVACSTNTRSENTTAGAVTGAVAGGLVGSAFGGGTGKLVAVGVGAIAGALIGGEVGKNMQSSDNTYVNRTVTHNPIGRTTRWTNNQTGAVYSMTPIRRVHVANYNHCREFQTTMTLNGGSQTTRSTACRMSNGQWVNIASN